MLLKLFLQYFNKNGWVINYYYFFIIFLFLFQCFASSVLKGNISFFNSFIKFFISKSKFCNLNLIYKKQPYNVDIFVICYKFECKCLRLKYFSILMNYLGSQHVDLQRTLWTKNDAAWGWKYFKRQMYFWCYSGIKKFLQIQNAVSYFYFRNLCGLSCIDMSSLSRFILSWGWFRWRERIFSVALFRLSMSEYKEPRQPLLPIQLFLF